MQTRDAGGGLGVHRPHWRENKNALFLRMKSERFAEDPHPGWPACFAHSQRLRKLLPGVAECRAAAVAEKDAPIVEPDPAVKDWRPERWFHTGLSSLADRYAFGRLRTVEADARGFDRAEKKAFVVARLPYHGTILQRHFRDLTPILDFVPAGERLDAAARCVAADPEQR